MRWVLFVDVGMIPFGVGPPIEVKSALWVRKLSRGSLRDGDCDACEVKGLPTHDARKDVEVVVTCEKPELRSIFGQEEMMVTRYAALANEKPTTARKVLVSIDPDVEGLPRFAAVEDHIHALDDVTPLPGGVDERTQEDLRSRDTIPTTAIRAEKYDGWPGHMDDATAKERKPRRQARDGQGY
ncbi:MAG: hypothetical protein ACREQO_17260 [Candidatus Binatia bacterium]